MLFNPSGNNFGMWYVKYLFKKIYSFSKTIGGRLKAPWKQEAWLVSSTLPDGRISNVASVFLGYSSPSYSQEDGLSTPSLCWETLAACPLTRVLTSPQERVPLLSLPTSRCAESGKRLPQLLARSAPWRLFRFSCSDFSCSHTPSLSTGRFPGRHL